MNKLKLVAIRKGFEFATKKSNKSLVSVACVEKSCKWRVRVIKYISSNAFRITKYEPNHSCDLRSISGRHMHASTNVIAEFIKERFREGKCPIPKEIMNIVSIELGCDVSYWTCWKAKQLAQNMIWGTPEHGYAALEAYQYEIEKANEDSFTALDVQDGRFLYFFVAYGPCIRGFKNIRNVLAMDGTFLTGQFGGVMLIASGQDSENQIYPIAWAVVNSENDLSWTWFFRQLLNVVPNTNELSIISDRNASIKKAIARVYDQAHHGVCIRHLGENIRTKFHAGSSILGLYYDASNAYRVEEFNEYLEEIRRKGYDNVIEYLKNDVGFERWSRVHFPGRRYDVMTSNIVESVNARLVIEREFPIVALFNAIQRMLCRWFHERRGLTLCTRYGQDARVNINGKICSCKVWDLQQLPCAHALATLKAQRLPDYGERVYNLCSPYYSAEFHWLAYSEIINPVPPEEQ
ncbi:uncharacterized protein LOC129884059 [Solanum dulcamara]|uniref:uncharacterized protein LOC129884059 n=1 Tax=Solanum dulcamara TaxID=45834 RepID=UPI0024866075|nr:uncharacterized protein LOC129884059 [Solanum dulcamara]